MKEIYHPPMSSISSERKYGGAHRKGKEVAGRNYPEQSTSQSRRASPRQRSFNRSREGSTDYPAHAGSHVNISDPVASAAAIFAAFEAKELEAKEKQRAKEVEESPVVISSHFDDSSSELLALPYSDTSPAMVSRLGSRAQRSRPQTTRLKRTAERTYAIPKSKTSPATDYRIPEQSTSAAAAAFVHPSQTSRPNPAEYDYKTLAPWCAIESDPDVFTEMTQKQGVKNIIVQEVFDLDSKLLNDKKQPDPDANGILYSCQVIQNACATLALLGVLLNSRDYVDLGEELMQFKDFVKGFDPISLGLAIGNSKMLRDTHNYFATEQDKKEAEAALEEYRRRYYTAKEEEDYDEEDKDEEDEEDEEKEEIYHFISYIYKNGYVWELDGLNRAPLKLDECHLYNWTNVVKPYLAARMESKEEGFLFNLMAVTDDNLPIQHRTIADKSRLIEAYSQRVELEQLRLPEYLTTLGKRKRDYPGIGYTIQVEIIEYMKKRQKILADDIKQLEEDIENENLEREKTKANNLRLGHDYTPFIETLFQRLDEHEALVPMLKEK
ncbi:hypothetical protein F4703DRAFT_1944265 [Phycomyces blakesleeanus]